MNCQNCGATLPPAAGQCPYCGAATAAGVWQQHQQDRQEAAREHYERAQEQQQRLKIEGEVKKSAGTALTVSIVGLILCCIPVIPIVAFVLALRARKLAQQHGVLMPGNATAAMIISGLSVLGFAGGLSYTILEDQRVDEHRARLEDDIEGDLKKNKLKQDAACKLVEVYVLRGDYDVVSDISLEEVDCPGKLTQDGDEAMLDDVRLRTGSESHEVIACFKRGSRWAVDSLQTTPCGEEAPEPKANASVETPPDDDAPDDDAPDDDAPDDDRAKPDIAQ